jgi:hypothetical protein
MWMEFIVPVSSVIIFLSVCLLVCV